MAYDSGIIITGNGYEGYVDRSRLTIDIAKMLLKKISDSDFNAGQQTIASNTRFDADVQQYWSIEYVGPIILSNSEVQSYSFSYDCPHEEAISDTLSYIVDEVQNTINSLFNNSDIGDSGADIADIHKQDWFNAFNKLGLFV
jgi:hypothetical protein